MKKIKILLTTAACSLICFSCINDEMNTDRKPKYDKIVIDLKTKIYNGVTDSTTIPTLMLWNENGTVITEQNNQTNLITANLPQMGEYNMMVVTNVKNINLNDTDNYYTIVSQNKPKLEKFYAYPIGTLIVNNNETQFFETELEQYNRYVNIIVSVDNANDIIETANCTIRGMAEEIMLSQKKLTGAGELTNPLNYPLEINENQMTAQFYMFGTIENETQNIVFSIKAKNESPKQLTYDLTKTLKSVLTHNPSNTIGININMRIFTTVVNGEYVFSFMNDNEIVIPEKV